MSVLVGALSLVLAQTTFFLPQMQTQGRGRIIFSADRAMEFRSILSELLEEYKQLSPDAEITESERLRR